MTAETALIAPNRQARRGQVHPPAAIVARSQGEIVPPGASWIEAEQAYNFSLYAKHAESVVLMSDDPRAIYRDYTGCGHTLACASICTWTLILESLRYWVTEMHVDGFRFDLASVLGRGPGGARNRRFLAPGRHPHRPDPPPRPPDRRALGCRLGLSARDPVPRAGVVPVERPVPGRRPPVRPRRSRDGRRAHAPALRQRRPVPDNPRDAHRPFETVNYVTCHDGFTLYDAVAYNEKRNWPNGHGNTDGAADNLSWNCGWEGDEDVPAAVMDLRKRQAKNFFCLLMLANGVPMFAAGDEFLRTQRGNTNPYNQDNETSWLDWSCTERHADHHRFAKRMIAFRKSHPSLGRLCFWRDDVRWYGIGPDVDLSYESHSLAYCLHGASRATTSTS